MCDAHALTRVGPADAPSPAPLSVRTVRAAASGSPVSTNWPRPLVRLGGLSLSSLLPCRDCPYLHDSDTPLAVRDWERPSLPQREWFIPCLAADWVRVNVLAAIVGVDPATPRLHLGGPFPQALLANLHPWEEVKALLDDRAQSRLQSLAHAFHASLPLGDSVPPGTFWGQVLAYTDELFWPDRRRRNPPLSVDWHPSRGFGILSRRPYRHQECRIPGLWGKLYNISDDYIWLHHHDTAITRSMVRGGDAFFVLLGTLALVNHACPAHANIIPDSQPGGEGSKRQRESGLTPTDYAGAHTINEPGCLIAGIFHPARPCDIRQGDELCYEYGPAPPSGAAPNSIRHGDDNHPPCFRCPASEIPANGAEGGTLPTEGIPAPCWSPLPVDSSDDDLSPSESDSDATDDESPRPPEVPGSEQPNPRRRKRTPGTPSSQTQTPLADPHDGWCGNPLSEHGTCTARRGVFRLCALNTHLSKGVLEKNLHESLRAMYLLDISAQAFSETNARRGSVYVDENNISECSGEDAGGNPVRWFSLWSFLPDGAKAGAGVTLVWDARFPFQDPYIDGAGRLAAVTLMGPKGPGIRLIAVYGYARPSSNRAGARALRDCLKHQLRTATAMGLRCAVFGDLNDSPPADQANFNCAPSSYPQHLSLTHLLCEMGFLDTFRLIHPAVHGHTFWRDPLSSKPSRLDSIWLSPSKRLGRALRGSHAGASVDGGRRYFSQSDHYAVLASISFQAVFRAPSKEVRLNLRRPFVERVDLSDILRTEEATKSFQSSLDLDPRTSSLRDRIAALRPCDSCRAILSPAPRLGQEDGEGTEVPPVQPGAPSATCSCGNHAAPPDPASTLSSLMKEWQDILLSHVAWTKPPARSRAHYTRRPPPREAIHIEASRLRHTLRHGPPSPHKQPQLLSTWNTFRRQAAAAGIPLPIPEKEACDLSDPIQWTRLVVGACTAVMTSCQKRAVKDHNQNIRNKIGARFAAYLLSEEGRGGSSAFLRRAASDGFAQIKHPQAPTRQGGLSTNPALVKKHMRKTFYEWFRARRSRCGARTNPLGPVPVADMFVGRGAPKTVTQAIVLSELRDSLAHAPRDSCPGPSRITIPLLRLCTDGFLSLLLMMLNMCLDWGTLPRSFQEGYIFPIPKKGKFSLDNSRPICLLEVHLKLLTRIINRRLVHQLLAEGFFSSIQFGFLPGRSCPDAFHILHGVIEDALEHGKPLHLCLVDLTKAFDSLSPEALQRAYREAGLSDRCCAFLGSLDGKGLARVLTPFGPTSAFAVEWGVRQGEVLSPTKFIIWLNTWLCHVERDLATCAYRMTDDLAVGNLAFADDLAIPSPSNKGLQTVMHSLSDFCSFHGVTISCHEDREQSKTVYITSQRNGPRLRISAFSRESKPGAIKQQRFLLKPYPRDHIFKYLGGFLSLDLSWGRISRQVKTSLQFELGKVIKKKLTLCEAITVAASVVQGKGGYYLQLGQYSKTIIRKLDASLDKALRIKAGAPCHGTAKHFHAPARAGGSNVFWFKRLQLQACGTELLVRLNSKGLVGEVARARWRAAHLAFPNWATSPPTPSQIRVHFTLYCALLLRSRGLWVFGPNSEGHLKTLFHTGARLCDKIHDDTLLLDLEDKGFALVSDLFTEESNFTRLKPYDAVCLKRKKDKSEAAWYTKLRRLNGVISKPPAYLPPSVDSDDGEAFFASSDDDGEPAPVSPLPGPPGPPAPADSSAHALGNGWDSEDERALRGAEGASIPPTTRDPNSHPTPTPAGATPAGGESEEAAVSSLVSDLGPSPPLVFFTDGSVVNAMRSPTGGFSIVTPHPIPGWTPRPKTRPDGSPYTVWGTGGKITRYGAEPVAIDLCELMAIVLLAEEGPPSPVVVYTDASYILKGSARPPRSQRRVTRHSNRPLWRRLRAAVSQRNEDGHPFLIRKCSSHGKDAQQHPTITRWNDHADELAGLWANSPGPGTHDWWPPGDDPYGLLYRGMAVRGDPRKFIGQIFSAAVTEHLKELKSGFVASLVARRQLNPTPLRTFKSPRLLAREGLLRLAGFCAQLQTLSLRTPYEYRFTKDPSILEYYCPRDPDGNLLCPACGRRRPDSWHVAGICPFGDAIREEARLVGGALLAGIQPHTIQGLDLPSKLGSWLCSATRTQGLLSYSEGPDTPKPTQGAVHLYTHLSHTSPDGLAVAWARKIPLGFALCPSRTLAATSLPKDCVLRTILCFPAGRYPLQPAPSATWMTDAIVLVRIVWTKKSDRRSRRLSPLADCQLKDLAHLLTSSILMGCWGLYLYWNGHPYQLDSLPNPGHLDLLDECELLPSLIGSSSRPPSDLWSSAWSWLGLWPVRLSKKLKELLEPWPQSTRALARKNLTLTAVLAQWDIWKLYRSVSQHYLRREKDVRRCMEEGAEVPPLKDPPRFLPRARAAFPPSRREINSIHRVKERLAGRPSVDSQAFLDAAARSEVSSSSRGSIWPMVFTTMDLPAAEVVPSGSAPLVPDFEIPAPPPPVASPQSPAPPDRKALLFERFKERLRRETESHTPTPSPPEGAAEEGAPLTPLPEETSVTAPSCPAPDDHTGPTPPFVQDPSAPSPQGEGVLSLPHLRSPLTRAEEQTADFYMAGVDRCLLPGCPLAQDVVDRALELGLGRLPAHPPDLPPGPPSTPSLGLISSYQSTLLLSESQWTSDHAARAHHNSRASHKALRTMASHDLTFIPFVLAHHWVGLIAQRPDRSGSVPWRGYIINSINGYATDEVVTAFKTLLSHPAGVPQGFRPGAGDKCTIHLVRTRQQGAGNSSDCGVLMALTMLGVMAHPDLVSAPPAPPWSFHQLRRWLALWVMQSASAAEESD